MLQITPQMKIYLALKPVDFRKGIDGLAAVCRTKLEADPFSGIVFVFKNKRSTSIKMLIYDGQGFWLCMKRLSKGKLAWWPDHTDDQNVAQIAAYQLQLLFYNGDVKSVGKIDQFKSITN
jgi:transposase